MYPGLWLMVQPAFDTRTKLEMMEMLLEHPPSMALVATGL